MAKAGTIREARSNVVTVARQIVAEWAEKGDVASDTMNTLTGAINVLNERTAASNAARKAARE